VRLYKTKIHQSHIYDQFKKTDAYAEMLLPTPLPVCGDVRIEFYNCYFGGRKEKIFQFWFNTFFTDMHVLQQEAQILEVTL